ncbi:MAG: acetolactate synthase small subunit [Oscillospiraceae bacterium]|jgi:acetolactate synthase-1/3 small subunit|nr:acetolactate synthase small subunit [Oscillospiraceae bacterium]
MKANTRSVFTLMVDNEFGVLTRITALIRRWGWNIRSLAVAETKTPEISRLTVCLECRHFSLEHVLEKLSTLNCVREVTLYEEETQVSREFALLRLSCGESLLAGLCERCDARVLEREADGSVILTVSAQPDELDALVAELAGKGLADIARTGAIALRRGREV